MKLGRGIELVQRHKAEEDLAVAAASILARNEFVTRLRDIAPIQDGFSQRRVRGGGCRGQGVCRQSRSGGIGQSGQEHFRTALRAQGLPEPPKMEWKKR